MTPKFTALKHIQAALHQGETTCETLVAHYLEQIAATRHLNIYIEVYADEALALAREQDQLRRADPTRLGRLHGMVLSLKDVICHEGHGVTAGSGILRGFTSLFSATAVSRVLAEGAIIIGRVNCDEFAMGSTTESSCYGPTRNAADPDRIPGGSSGGSAVAVQADTCLASLGSDTGGSVRQPAGFCGIVGTKPTYGRISRYGLLAYGSSFDQIGVLSHSVRDAALLLEVMAGPDEYDSTAAPQPVAPYTQLLRHEGQARIAYFRAALEHPSLDPAVRAACWSLLDRLAAEGHAVTAVDFDYFDYMIPAYYVLTTAEASSNLSRYDGIRFGHRSPSATTLEETYKQSRAAGFGKEVKRRIMLGTFVLSAGYYDAYYTKAQKVRRLIQEQTLAVFAQHDFILQPTAPGMPWRLGEAMDDPVAVYLTDIFSVQANMVGIPAISVPLPPDPATGLPIGVQLMADRFQEAAMLAFAGHILGEE